MEQEERLRTALADSYTILREIGSGGMATVYLAHDRKHDRQVAVKVLARDLAESVGTERFLREISTAARLTHPHILPVHDSGRADGFLFYVMPYVEGESLRARIDRAKQLPVEDAIRIAREIADALDHAHAQGIVHRDVKPANIMFEAGHAVLADFGVAHAVEEAKEDRLTRTGTAMGTPAYMSPEQASGEQNVDGRSDIYSLGCVLYEMLAGDPPFTGSTPASVLARQVRGQVPLLNVVRPNLPAALVKVVEKALEKVPADRHPTASELGEALDRARPGLGDGAGKGPSVRVGPGHLAVLGFLAVMALGGYAVVSRGGGTDSLFQDSQAGPLSSAERLGRIAVTYFDVYSDDPALEALADALTEQVTNGLVQLGTLDVLPRTAMKPFKGRDLPAEDIAELGIDAYVEGSVMGTSEQLTVSVQLIDAHDLSHIASDLIHGSAGAPYAILDELAGEVSGLLREWLGVRIEMAALQTGTHSETAWNLVQRASECLDDGVRLSASGDTAAAGRMFQQADEILERAEAEDPSYLTPIIDRGWVAAERSMLGTSGSAYDPTWTRVGIAHAERALAEGPDNPRALELQGVLLDNLAAETLDTAEADSLRSMAEAVLRRATELDGSRSQAFARLSRIYRNQGRYAEAKLAAEKAYRADPYQMEAALILFRLCEASLNLELWTEVTHWCEEGRKRFPNNASFASAELAALAGPRGPRADPELAWLLADEVIRLEEPLQRAQSTPPQLLQVAAVLARAGLPDSARAVLNRALALPEATGPRVWIQEANARLQMGDVDGSLDALERFLEVLPSQRPEISRDWWWERLRTNPRFRALVDTVGG